MQTQSSPQEQEQFPQFQPSETQSLLTQLPTTTPAIDSLLHYQSNFTTMVHTNFYPISSSELHFQRQNHLDSLTDSEQPKKAQLQVQKLNSNILIKFQVEWVTLLTQKFGTMVKQLNEMLVKRREDYDTLLRDHFHKVLDCDFLPLLRFSRYQVTQISLYGFDIYVPPLQAILQILNRIDTPKVYLIQNLTEQSYSKCSSLESRQDPISILQKSWEGYLIYLSLWRVSFNIYLLKDYLKVANKSLVRKDKDIVFTGCNNLFDKLIPKLCQSKCFWILKELGELNNQLYFFHPSYDLFRFYSLLIQSQRAKEEWEDVFSANLKVVALKCQAAGIITPLLFGIMRNYSAVIKLVKQVDNSVWIPYLQILLQGLFINVKGRILQYEEIMRLISITMSKLTILGDDLTSIAIVGDLQKNWGQAKDFFISAIKLGYGVGELQTWHPLRPEDLQHQIVVQTINSLLLLQKPIQSNLLMSLLTEPDQHLEQYIHETSGNKVSLQHILGQKTLVNISYLLTELTGDETTQQHQLLYQERVLQLLRIINLYEISLEKGSFDEEEKVHANLACCLIGSLLKLKRLIEKEGNIPPIKERLLKIIISKLSHIINQLTNQNKFEDQKYLFDDRIVNLFIDFYQSCQAQGIFITLSSILLHSRNHSKQCLTTFIKMIKPNNKQSIDIASALIISSYFNKKEIKQNHSRIKVKTFQKEFTIPHNAVNLTNKERLCISVLLEMHNAEGKNTGQVDVVTRILSNIIKVNPSKGLGLLTFPITLKISNKQCPQLSRPRVQPFSNYLLVSCQPSKTSLLLHIITLCLQSIKTSENENYIQKVTLPGLCCILIKHINGLLLDKDNFEIKGKKVERLLQHLSKLDKMYSLLELGSKQRKQVNSNLVQCYRYVLAKVNEIQKHKQEEVVEQDVIQAIKDCLMACTRIMSTQVFKDAVSWNQFIRTIMRRNINFTGTMKFNNEFDTFQTYQIDNSLVKQINSSFCIEDYEYMETVQPAQKLKSPRFSNININQDLSKAANKDIVIIRWEDTLKKIQQISNINSQQEMNPNPQLPSWSLISQSWKTSYQSSSCQNILQDLMEFRLYIMPQLSRRIIDRLLPFTTEQSLPEFISILWTNPRNNHNCLLWALENNNQTVLRLIGMTRLMLLQNRLSDILSAFKTKENGAYILQSMVQHLTPAEQSNFAESFSFSLAFNDLQTFLQIATKSKLSFLLTRSQSNWRIFIDQIIKQFGKNPRLNNIPSILLQYDEYVQITNNLNKQYSAILKEYKDMVTLYSRLLKERSIVLQQQLESHIQKSGQKDGQLPEQIRLAIMTEIANAKLLISTAKCKQTLKKLGKLNREIISRKLNQKQPKQVQTLKGIVQSYHQINNIFNQGFSIRAGHFRSGHIVPSDFAYGNQYQNIAIAGKMDGHEGLLLGKYLEIYDKVFREATQKQELDELKKDNFSIKNSKYYLPSEFKKLAWPQFVCMDKLDLIQPLKVTISQSQKQQVSKFYEDELKALKEEGLVQVSEDNVLSISLANSNPKEGEQNTASRIQQRLYKLGMLYQITGSQTSLKLSSLIIHLRERIPLSWQFLKQSHPQQYHFIKSILINSRIRDQNLFWTYQEKELIINGGETLVTEGNKLEYCNKVALYIMGSQVDAASWFAKGIIYAKIDNKQEFTESE